MLELGRHKVLGETAESPGASAGCREGPRATSRPCVVNHVLLPEIRRGEGRRKAMCGVGCCSEMGSRWGTGLLMVAVAWARRLQLERRMFAYGSSGLRAAVQPVRVCGGGQHNQAGNAGSQTRQRRWWQVNGAAVGWGCVAQAGLGAARAWWQCGGGMVVCSTACAPL